MTNEIHIPVTMELIAKLSSIRDPKEADDFYRTWYGLDPSRFSHIEVVGTNIDKPIIIISINLPR